MESDKEKSADSPNTGLNEREEVEEEAEEKADEALDLKAEDNIVDDAEEKMDVDKDTTVDSEPENKTENVTEDIKEEDIKKEDIKNDGDETKEEEKMDIEEESEDSIKAPDQVNESKVKEEVTEDKLVDDVQDLSKKANPTSEEKLPLTNGIGDGSGLDEPLYLGKKVNGHAKSETGSVNSEDSEKENMNIDLPIDLSTKQTSGQDIIMLSDESEIDDGILARGKNGDKDYCIDELKIKRKMIKRLQAELRNEEAKLVLLKKLRLSQMSPQVQDMRKPQAQSQPPPLVRGGQAQQAQAQQAKPAHNATPQLGRGSGGNLQGLQNKSQGPPPLVMAPRIDQRQLLQNQMKLIQQQQQQQLKEQQQRTMSTPSQQSSLPGFRGSQAQAEALRQMQQAQQQRVVEETPAQRQAAAKLALRKQLEKTLLQIPPPKPPPPEMNFIPSLASPDFVYLLGLEEAVNFIIDTNLISKGRKNPDEKMVCNPFTCVQCGTDFTPVWKREKPGSKNVICEQCVTTNQKKALKQEHTNRLKSAFVKALQQEQEIERMQSQEAKAAPPPAPPKEKPEPREREREREQRDRERERERERERGEREREREREREPREVSSAAQRSAAQTYKETMAETLRQHQNLLQAHQAAALRMGQPLGLQAFNPRAPPFPYQMPFPARASELQRQYLLDMIPKGGLPWNT